MVRAGSRGRRGALSMGLCQRGGGISGDLPERAEVSAPDMGSWLGDPRRWRAMWGRVGRRAGI